MKRYVEFGLRSTSPGPFLCSDGHMRLLVLNADAGKLRDLTESTLNAGGAKPGTTYRALGARLVFLAGRSEVTACVEPWSRWGRVPEVLAAFFVPVWAGEERRGRFHADRLCLSVPHIFVDNPMSFLGGREVYGFAKALGRFDPPKDFLGARFTVCGFGGEIAPDSVADWCEVLAVEPEPGVSPSTQALGDWPALAHALLEAFGLERLVAGDEEEVEIDGVVVVVKTLRDLIAGRLRLVFLKQFRDAVEPGAACYQEVIEVPAHVEHVSPGRTESWQVCVTPVDSLPLGAELGLAAANPADFSALLRDFRFKVGEERVSDAG